MRSLEWCHKATYPTLGPGGEKDGEPCGMVEVEWVRNEEVAGEEPLTPHPETRFWGLSSIAMVYDPWVSTVSTPC